MTAVILVTVVCAWWTAAAFYETELARLRRRAEQAEARLARLTGRRKPDNCSLSADQTRKGA